MSYDLGPVVVGAALQTPSLHLLGEAETTVHSGVLEGSTEATQAGTVSGAADGSYRRLEPARVSVGVAREGRHGAFELDAVATLPRSLSAQRSSSSCLPGRCRSPAFGTWWTRFAACHRRGRRSRGELCLHAADRFWLYDCS